MLAKKATIVKGKLARIMGRAWEIRREAAAEIGCKVSDILMGVCLKRAWADESAGAAAVSVMVEWESMDDEGRVSAIKYAVWRAAAKIGARSGLVAEQVLCDDIDAYINETWIDIGDAFDNLDALEADNRRRAQKGIGPRTVKSILIKVATRAIMAINRDVVKHAQAEVSEWTVVDGEEVSLLEAIPSGEDFTREIDLKTAIEEFTATRDEKDQIIIDGLMYNETMRELGEKCKMSHVGVVKRVKNIRAAMIAAGIV